MSNACISNPKAWFVGFYNAHEDYFNAYETFGTACVLLHKGSGPAPSSRFFARPLMQGPCKMPLCVKMISMWELHGSLLLLFDVLSYRLPGSNPSHPSFSFHPTFLHLFWSAKQLELFRDLLLSCISSVHCFALNEDVLIQITCKKRIPQDAILAAGEVWGVRAGLKRGKGS